MESTTKEAHRREALLEGFLRYIENHPAILIPGMYVSMIIYELLFNINIYMISIELIKLLI